MPMPTTNLHALAERLRPRWEDASRLQGAEHRRPDGTPRSIILPEDVMWKRVGTEVHIQTVRSKETAFVGYAE